MIHAFYYAPFHNSVMKGRCIMGKRLVKWSLDGAVLRLSKPAEDPKSVVTIDAEFDMARLLKVLFAQEWGVVSEVGKQAFVYFAKQKLMDTGASEKGNYHGKVSMAKTKYTELLEGKWAGERVNATGASENKKLLSKMKETSTVVSLDGLLMKKMLHEVSPTNPQLQWTDADEAKYQELVLAAAEAIRPKGRK